MSPEQIQQKYNEERDKRLRPDGTAQYLDLATSEKFKHFVDDPWLDPHAQAKGLRLTNDSRVKILVLGAGYGGLLFALRLLEAGFKAEDICIVDSAGGFGGTWYWNRYPGAMCDVESYIYMPLLEETGYMPQHKYAYGPELREYAEMVAEKWGLEGRTVFRTVVSEMKWDEVEKEWVVEMKQKEGGEDDLDFELRASFVIAASGLLNYPKVPRLPGLDAFRGHCFHTSRWDYRYTGGSPEDPSLENLKDKRVGIIGTGATAVQAVPHLAKWAKELYVFQRTPSAVDTRGNRPTDAEWWQKETQSKKGWHRQRRENFAAFVSNVSPPPSIDMVADGWTTMPSFSALVGGPAAAQVTLETIAAHVASLHALDFPRSERIRARVDEVVNDKTTAENLKAWYPGWCKRPCFHDEYLQSFNLPQVTLVDTDGRGVDRLTDHGVVVEDSEYNLDLLILGTGYNSPVVGSPARRAGFSVIGCNGLSMEQKWDDSGAGTLHGIISRDFPNFLFPGPQQAGASANQAFLLDLVAEHVAYILSQATQKAKAVGLEKVVVEPSAAAEQEWSMRIMAGAVAFAGLAGCTPSYFNREGEFARISTQEEQMKAAKGGIWSQGLVDYAEVIEGWRRSGDLKGLEITVSNSN
ncbi:hypothetical protein H2201_005336 [Coniosporium apollinis]|uniref:FAD/NAD(P)-binding domain-containing protein n=1 Tax=Coniosporium apollinis TaxID=61459 RepID=A0ABQ9NQ72_9PEZI|nr:hypothetical protein H2201_005336 [Coniosporium apollinis]